MKRSRGRGRRQQNPVNRSYDSNGPEVRVRGTASQVYEKYQTLARDAMSAGDRVMAENYQQHAEHYFRILQSFQQQQVKSDDAAQSENGVSENGAADEALVDDNGMTNGNGDADAELGGEPLVLVRGNDDAGNDDADNDGEEGDKKPSNSRRRGPLGKKRGTKAGNGNDAAPATAGEVPAETAADDGAESETATAE